MGTYDNICKVATGQGDDYATRCLIDYNYFQNYYKMIAIDLSKLRALDADPKAIQQINFSGNLERDNGAIMIFTLKMQKKSFQIFRKEQLEYCSFILF